MIRTIRAISSFGVFDNFRWHSAIPEFKKYNLIYGWNYSGKTTLSRAFRCFELKQRHEHFPNANFEIQDEAQSIHTYSSFDTLPVFRVFNSDFVRDNLKFDDGSAEPILTLGQEDIDKQNLLEQKRSELESIQTTQTQLATIKKEISDGLESAFTKYARDLIKNPLSAVSYSKSNFKPKVESCCDEHQKYLLEDNVVSNLITTYNSNDKKDSLEKIENELTSTSGLVTKVKLLLEKVVTVRTVLSRLDKDKDIEKWVSVGRSLHNGAERCHFCDRPLPEDLLDQLSNHFSAEYDELIEQCTSLIAEIKLASEQSIATLPQSDFYKQYAAEYKQSLDVLKSQIADRKKCLQLLSESLVDKQLKVFTKLVCPAIVDQDKAIALSVNKINKLIDSHNSKTSAFENDKQSAFDSLELHYAASFVENETYNEKKNQLTNVDRVLATAAQTIEQIRREIRDLEAEILEASRGAEGLNDLITAYFGRPGLSIVVTPDNRFQITRNGAIATNLSEGEKTGIAFAYFIMLVKDGRSPLNGTRIFIDDPMSSLDATHLFNTYALLKSQLEDCKQLFISTHSFEFYSLLRDWAKDDSSNWGMYLVTRNDNGFSGIDKIPDVLLKFKSEYHYLFSIIHNFDAQQGANFDSLYSLPNIIRRFLEAFGGIMIPSHAGLRSKMPSLFPDPLMQERVFKFINLFSHNQNVFRSLNLPDMSECRAIAKACLEAVKAWDQDYYNTMVTAVQ